MNLLLLLLLLELSLLAAAPASAQLCGDNPPIKIDDMTFFSTIPGYPDEIIMVRPMERIIKDQFHGDQDGPLVDTACCYEPDILIDHNISLPPDCSVITFANRDSCFAALGPAKNAIVQRIDQCVSGMPVTTCTDIPSNSSFLARNLEDDEPPRVAAPFGGRCEGRRSSDLR